MISSWRRRKESRQSRKIRAPDENIEIEVTIPSHFRCPISLDLMKDPVTLSTGITYDRQSIETWIENGNFTCPITNQELMNLEPTPNHSLRKMIQNWCVENKSYGIERIPTPRTPVSSFEVMETLSKLRGDQEGCLGVVKKIKAFVKESERNRRTVVENGASGALSRTFEAFSETSCSSNKSPILEEILSCLTFMFPLEERAKSHLGSSKSLKAIVWLLRNGDLSSRRNSVLVLKEISSGTKSVEALVGTEGATEGLFKLIKEPISTSTTKASLMTIYHILTSSFSSPRAYDEIRMKFVEMGVVSVLLEMLVDSEKSICEKALAVLDEICNCDEGRKKAYAHELTVPILVKKLLRVSDLATSFSVSILWKLSKNDNRVDEGILVEALQVGAFQKLLLLLQVGSFEKTKEKASELLKLMNVNRDRCECIDSLDFKDLKRPF